MHFVGIHQAGKESPLLKLPHSSSAKLIKPVFPLLNVLLRQVTPAGNCKMATNPPCKVAEPQIHCSLQSFWSWPSLYTEQLLFIFCYLKLIKPGLPWLNVFLDQVTLAGNYEKTANCACKVVIKKSAGKYAKNLNAISFNLTISIC